jgi:hypothetical protein
MRRFRSILNKKLEREQNSTPAECPKDRVVRQEELYIPSLRGTKQSCLCFLFFVFCSLFFFSSCLEERIKIPTPTIELHKGYSFQLTALSDNVEWVSENPSIATVSLTGLVTAKNTGKTVIYTHSSKGRQDVACYLEVYPTRNILFYIATGDASSIDNDTQGKIDSVRNGIDPNTGEMIIYSDRRAKGAFLFKINKTKDSEGLYGLDTLEVYGNENSADASKITRAINYMTTHYPADCYGMIFFAHGSGWLPEGTLNRPRSLVIDTVNGSKKEIEYYDFAAAIPAGTLDFIIFEECFMADAAFMYELRNKTDYVLASSAEIVSPGYTFIYKERIKDLFDTKRPVEEGLKSFGQSYVNYLKTNFSENDDYCSVTMSLIKAPEMEALATATKSALNGMDIKESNLRIDSIQRFDRPRELSGQSRSRYFDLGHTVDSLATQTATFKSQLNKTVVWKDASANFMLGYNGFKINYHSGMSIYIKQDAFPYLNSRYEETAWYKAIR